MRRLVKWAGAFLCLLCGLVGFYLAITNPSEAGGRAGLLVVALIFLALAVRLAKSD